MDVAHHVDLAGFTVSYSAETDEQLHRLGWFFGGLPPRAGPIDLAVRLGAGDPGRPDELEDSAARHGPTQRWEHPDGVIIGHDLGAWARITADELRIVCPADVDDPWRAERHLLFSGVSWWLERHDLIILHGAMLGRGRDAALIVGDTGSGKSTAAFAGQRAGWDLCSDDLVVVGRRDGRLQAFGIPKPLSIDADIARSADVQGDAVPGDERARVMITDGEMTTGWRAIRMVVAVGHHQNDGAIVPLAHAETMDVTMLACLEADRPDAVSRHLGTLALLASTPGFELLHAADPARRVRRAADLLEEAWGAATDIDDQ